MDNLAILIPCYNEVKTISKVVSDFLASCPGAVVYVYDNNSTDGTGAAARQAGATVRNEFQQGKGNVIRRMFREVNANCYILVDGDDTYPAECAPEMARLVLEQKADMVIGDRLSSTYFAENKRRFHNFGNMLMRGCINYLFKSDIRDIMTGYRAFSYEFVKTFPVLSRGFEIETEMTIHAVDKHLYIENYIVEYRNRPEGSTSKLNTVADGIKVIATMFSLFRSYYPFRFFGMIALILGLLAGAFFAPIFVDYLHTGLVPNFPTLMMCGFAAVSAIQSFFIGLQLQTILQKNRQDFEISLIRVSTEKEMLEYISDNMPQRRIKLER